MTRELRKIDHNGSEIYACPNGCDESELELGRDESSFMAILGKPYKYIRCGNCGFGEESKGTALKLEMPDVIEVWNKACEEYSQKRP